MNNFIIASEGKLKRCIFRKQVNISRIEYALKKVLPSYIKAIANETRKNASLSKDYARVRKYKHVYVENGEDEVTKSTVDNRAIEAT